LKPSSADPSFRGSIDAVHAEALLSGLIDEGVLVEDPPVRSGLTPDPGDDYLVALAQKAEADCIVSGDAHIRELRDAIPPVLTPRVRATTTGALCWRR
jgi:predicted nucleic acid-binding protein